MGLLDLFRRRKDKRVPPAAPQPVRTPPVRIPAVLPTAGHPVGFAVVDVETTGLSASQHRVLEVAVVRTDPYGRVLGEWVRRLNPDGPVGVTHIHGITDADVAGAPRFGDIVVELNSWLAGAAVVAHNAAFDLAFLRAEYAYQGWALPWLPTLCTLEASGHYLPELDRRRLLDCCGAARIRVEGAHSALGDARATAALLGFYLHPHVGRRPRPADLDLLHQATAVQWPTTPSRRPQTPTVRAAVLPRIRASARPVTTASLVTLLADFSLTDALDEGARPGTLPYLEKLAETLEDGVLTAEEGALLDEVSLTYQLSAEDRAGAHRALLLALCHLALDDGRVSQAERREMRAMAGLLGLADGVVTAALDQAERARHARLSAGLRSLPAGWPHGEPLRVGDKVVFTGCDERLRLRLEKRAEELGVRVLNAVSRKTAMLVTDGSCNGTKAEAARQLGTRTVHPQTFELLLRHLQPALARRSDGSGSAPVGEPVPAPPPPTSACDSVQADPAVVRRWARANGYSVGDRGRLSREVFDAYESALTR